VDDAALLRYSRHLLLNEFGAEAQQALLEAHVLVVGAGGLGSSALLHLAAAGVGRITIADGDRVDLTNLQRQIVHRESRLGENKAHSAVASMAEINSTLTCVALSRRLAGNDLDRAVADSDVVLDCSDNFATRYALNAACVREQRPLVSGAGIRFDGQIAVFDLRQPDAACYHCLFPRDLEAEEERCAVMGVFAPLVGVIGTLQAAEALKLIAGVGQSLAGRLTLYDALNARWHEVRVRRDPHCAVCAERANVCDPVQEVQHA
jgi:adenylyltransferase/sulfurtransferase